MIGLEKTFDEHLENLVAVFREVRRVLRDDGTLWLNYGDAYAGGGRGPGGATKQVTNAGSNMPAQHPNEYRCLGLKPKDLMMMPARVAMALQADGAADIHAMKAIMDVRNRIFDAYDGQDETPPDRILAVLEAMQIEYAQAKGESWWLRSEIIWAKPNPMPESCTDRPTSSHEKLFLLTKSARYFYDAEAVRQPASQASLAQYSKPYKGTDGKDYTNTGVQNGRDIKRRMVDKQRGHGRRHAGFNDRWDAIPKDDQQSAGANLRNVWTISTHNFKGAHFATFPPALVEPCIKAGTSERGVCGECGAPWNRATERVDQGWDGSRYGERAVAASTATGGTAKSTLGSPGGKQTGKQKTTGWAPTCEHKADPVPATVLDCFAGSGTVGAVALAHNRRFIGIEINGDYTDMERRRILGPLFAELGEG